MPIAGHDHVPQMPEPERAIRSLAAARGLPSLGRLARVARVSRLTLRRAVRGETRPRRHVVLRVAAALGVEATIVERILADARAARAAEAS